MFNEAYTSPPNNVFRSICVQYLCTWWSKLPEQFGSIPRAMWWRATLILLDMVMYTQ